MQKFRIVFEIDLPSDHDESVPFVVAALREHIAFVENPKSNCDRWGTMALDSGGTLSWDACRSEMKGERPKPPSVMDDLPSIGDAMRKIIKGENREGSLVDLTPKTEKSWVESMVGMSPQDQWVCWGKDCQGHFTPSSTARQAAMVLRAQCKCAMTAMRDYPAGLGDLMSRAVSSIKPK